MLIKEKSPEKHVKKLYNPTLMEYLCACPSTVASRELSGNLLAACLAKLTDCNEY